MLINDFFTIIDSQQTENEIVYRIKLNKNHKVYQGHFPEQPIAPGVCLAQTVKELCENNLNSELKMDTARSMKFMAVLNPYENEEVSVSLRIKENENKYSVRANCFNDSVSFFKIDAVYTM